MNIQFRVAKMEDLPEVYSMFSSAISEMEKNNIFQWDNVYPDKKILSEDIQRQQLYVGEVDCELVCAYVVNDNADEQYSNGTWKYVGCTYKILHRLCVNPKFQNVGVGTETMLHIEKEAKKEGVESIRLDAFSKNPYAVQMYEKLNYTKVGVANWRKGRFYLMEKKL
ncbi:MAG: GNAT family N-acetyltransferase [Oscillospiraceae bacterium]|nr:GNAT family N-acetyltransferase [Oscillospiraceae bacterium]